jgi:hypothetical protein
LREKYRKVLDTLRHIQRHSTSSGDAVSKLSTIRSTSSEIWMPGEVMEADVVVFDEEELADIRFMYDSL